MKLQPIFHTGGALTPDYPHYVLRQADQAASRAVDRGRLIYTIAPRQMGKTSLLKRLSARLQRQDWYCCFVDLATLKNLEHRVWFRHLGRMIAQCCEVDTILSSLEDQLDFRAFLLNDVGLGLPFNPIKLALVFDEVEGLLGLDFSDEFLMTLRDLYQQRDQHPGQLLVAFAGSIDPATLVKDPTISPFNVAEEIVLADFTAAESLILTRNLAGLGVPVEEAVHSHIHEWTAGQPHLTQRICEIIESWVETEEIASVSTNEVDRVVHKVLLTAVNRDKNIKHVLSEIANLEALPAELWRRLLAGKPVHSTEAGFCALYLTGAVTEMPDRCVKIRNRIYDQVLKGYEVVKKTDNSPQTGSTVRPVSSLARGPSFSQLPSKPVAERGEVNYERGLEVLRLQVEQTNRYAEFNVLEARLLENLHDDRVYGPGQQSRSDRARVIDQLNRLTLDVLGVTFNDLSLGRAYPGVEVSATTLPLTRKLGVTLTPSDIEPPTQPRLQSLPLNELSWEQFEALCAALVEANPLTVDCHLYGVQGDDQLGIDIVATQRDVRGDEIWAYQCKRYKDYTAGKLREAITKMTYAADYHVLMLSIPAKAALRQVADENPNVFLWDATDIARKLKNYPTIVKDFFGAAWQKAFCG